VPLADIGPYRVIRLIKSGGQGSVFVAEDRRLGRRVAIKLWPLPEQPAAREQVLEKARLLATLSHPNLVQLYDVVETAENLALVMEYVSGNDLEELLAVAGLETGAALRVALDLCSALAQAHARGVIHGDLKPANILVGDSGRIKLTDFGIAFPEGARAPAGGTPATLSPEQASGAPCDGRSDLFALGCLLYRLLAHRQPFPGRLANGRVDWPTPPTLASLGVRAPAAIDPLISALLQVDPAARPTSTLQVRQVLLAACREHPVNQELGPGSLSAGLELAASCSASESQDGQATSSTRARPLSPSLARLISRQGALAAGLAILAMTAVVLHAGRDSVLPLAVVVEWPVVDPDSDGSGLSEQRLNALLTSAVESAPGLSLARESGDSRGRLSLHARCNSLLCVSQLVLETEHLRRADTRALLPDAGDREWTLLIDQGLEVVAREAR
jgi:serine/threonine protein kinase